MIHDFDTVIQKRSLQEFQHVFEVHALVFGFGVFLGFSILHIHTWELAASPMEV